jgi:hypothetical protein
MDRASRLQRIKDHLLEVEKQTGLPLTKVRRHKDRVEACPIIQFANPGNKETGWLISSDYLKVNYMRRQTKQIWEDEDTIWWRNLSTKIKEYYLKNIELWLSTRNKGEE